jgi:dihydrofolate reductase
VRKVTYGAATSLDGFIARKDHSVDWLQWSDDVSAITSRFWKSVDTVLMGRKTYEVVARGGMTSYPGVKNYVFSRTLKESPDPKVELVSDDAAGVVQALKTKKGKGICVMGGGEFAHSLFEADLIDEVGMNLHPVLLGSGIPLFLESRHQLDLELVECKPIKKGCVYVLYRVTRSS